MEYPTWYEIRKKAERQLDLEGELFITPEELLAHGNAAVNEAEADIHKLKREDEYFMTSAYIPMTEGDQFLYPPEDIYANKIKKLMYVDQHTIYDIARLRHQDRFTSAEFLKQNPPAFFYSYIPKNISAEKGIRLELYPYARETTGWNLFGSLTEGSPIVNGFSALPAGLAVGQEVEGDGIPEGATIITVNPTTIELSAAATVTKQNSRVKVHLSKKVKCWYIRNANRFVDDSSLCDIPEFSEFIVAYVSYWAALKENHPATSVYKQELEQQRQLMLGTLSEMVPDDNDEVLGDYSFYEEHS